MNGLLREIEEAEDYLERFGDVLPAPALAKHQAQLQELVDEHQRVSAKRFSTVHDRPVEPRAEQPQSDEDLLRVYRDAWSAFHRLGRQGMARRIERKAAAVKAR